MILMSPSFRGSYRLIFPEVDDACSCPVCGYVLRDDKDMKSFFEKEACATCLDIYYYPNADQWDAGWRPDRDKVRKNDV